MVQHGLFRFPCARAAFLGLLILGGLAAGSCDKAPLTAPSGSAITLVASPAAIPANGAADITAFVIEGAMSSGTEETPGRVVPGVGTPVHNGTEVFFTTTLGRIEPADAQTVSGRATARLIGGDRSGTAVVRATSGGATSTIEVDIGELTADADRGYRHAPDAAIRRGDVGNRGQGPGSAGQLCAPGARQLLDVQRVLEPHVRSHELAGAGLDDPLDDRIGDRGGDERRLSHRVEWHRRGDGRIGHAQFGLALALWFQVNGSINPEP